MVNTLGVDNSQTVQHRYCVVIGENIMVNFHFTHYWSRRSCDYYMSIGQEGLPLDHTAGSRFMERTVSINDFVYVVTTREGELFLIGKMQVGEIVFSDEEAKARIGYEPWSAPQHLIAKSCTPMRFDRPVPLEATRSLRFIGPVGSNLNNLWANYLSIEIEVPK